MNLRFLIVLPLLPLFFLSSCRDQSGDTGKASRKPIVFASNYPIFYFAERIAGKHMDLRFDVPSGVDPAFHEPSDTDIAAMQNADLLLMNGATYSKWIEYVSLPEHTRVDTSKDFSKQLIVVQGSAPHQHGNGKMHSHDGTASITWLDFHLASMQAGAIRDALIKLTPEHKMVFEENADVLLADLKHLDTELLEIGKLLADKTLLASHPVYQYLARRYALKIEALSWAPEKVPGDADLLELDLVREEYPSNVLIWEATPASESVKILQKSGIRSIVFDPCANRRDRGDWLAVMKENVDALRSLR